MVPAKPPSAKLTDPFPRNTSCSCRLSFPTVGLHRAWAEPVPLSPPLKCLLCPARAGSAPLLSTLPGAQSVLVPLHPQCGFRYRAPGRLCRGSTPKGKMPTTAAAPKLRPRQKTVPAELLHRPGSILQPGPGSGKGQRLFPPRSILAGPVTPPAPSPVPTALGPGGPLPPALLSPVAGALSSKLSVPEGARGSFGITDTEKEETHACPRRGLSRGRPSLFLPATYRPVPRLCHSPRWLRMLAPAPVPLVPPVLPLV